MHPLEGETVARLGSMGYNFNPYIVPASYLSLGELGVSQEDLEEGDGDVPEDE